MIFLIFLSITIVEKIDINDWLMILSTLTILLIFAFEIILFRYWKKIFFVVIFSNNITFQKNRFYSFSRHIIVSITTINIFFIFDFERVFIFRIKRKINVVRKHHKRRFIVTNRFNSKEFSFFNFFKNRNKSRHSYKFNHFHENSIQSNSNNRFQFFEFEFIVILNQFHHHNINNTKRNELQYLRFKFQKFQRQFLETRWFFKNDRFDQMSRERRRLQSFFNSMNRQLNINENQFSSFSKNYRNAYFTNFNIWHF